MSDSARGFVVLGAARTRLQRWLGERRLASFLAPGPGKGVRWWPLAEPEAADEAARALTAELPGARVLAFSAGEASLHFAAYAEGACATREEVAPRLRTAKQLSQAHAALQRVAAVLGYKGRLPTLLRDEASRPCFLALAGVEEQAVAALSASRLEALRSRPEDSEAEAFRDFLAVEADGRTRPLLPKA